MVSIINSYTFDFVNVFSVVFFLMLYYLAFVMEVELGSKKKIDRIVGSNNHK